MDLVILAAGMGSRFGGLKQIEPIDEYNNFIIDYTNKENGKISSFIKDIDKNGFFESRIINNLIDFTIFSNSKIKFSHNLSSNNIVFSYRKILGLI